jgi:transketolase
LDTHADPYLSADARPAIHHLALSLTDAGRTATTLAAATAALFARHLRFDAADAAWPDRDRVLLGGEAISLAPRLDSLLDAAPGLADIFSQCAGQSLGAALGAAMAERMLAARFGRSLVDHRVWLLADGAELASGAAQEAAAQAGQLQLGRLTVLAAIGAAESRGLARFTAMGWTLRHVPAGDAEAAAAALSAAMRSRKPTLIACLEQLRPHPGAGLRAAEADWACIGHRGAGARRAWLKRLKRHTSREEFERGVLGQLPPGWQSALPAPTGSPANAVETALSRVAPVIPGLAACPAEPHAVGATLIGMALHGGIIPVGRKPLADSETLRPGMRLAAQRGLRLVQLLIEPGDPCPTGGMRTAWRAMRNVHVFRPADAAEALTCLELALRRASGPSVLMLTQAESGMPERAVQSTRGCFRGGYLVVAPGAPRALTLIASGPELALALAAAEALAVEDIAVAVVSLPCWDLFALQDECYRAGILGDAPRLGLGAGSGFGWERHLGAAGRFIGPSHGAIDLAQVLDAARAMHAASRRTQVDA